jgi:methylated-DNA-[protein]-cysteine S-methyltransferase
MRFAILDSDFGSVVLFARASHLSRLDLVEAPAGARDRVRTQFPEAREEPRFFEEVEGLLRRYFRGEQVEFTMPLDLSELPAFTRRVLAETRKIPHGKLASYAMIAGRSGRPFGARAVGQALHRNPIPLIIPCHRVVKKDGSLGGFGMGLDMKVRLLALEGIRVDHLQTSMLPSQGDRGPGEGHR